MFTSPKTTLAAVFAIAAILLGEAMYPLAQVGFDFNAADLELNAIFAQLVAVAGFFFTKDSDQA